MGPLKPTECSGGRSDGPGEWRQSVQLHYMELKGSQMNMRLEVRAQLFRLDSLPRVMCQGPMLPMIPVSLSYSGLRRWRPKPLTEHHN